MCFQLDRLPSSVRTKPNWKQNMEYGKRKAGYIFYIYRLRLKPPKSHPAPDVTYLHKWEIDKAKWIQNMKKGDY